MRRPLILRSTGMIEFRYRFNASRPGWILCYADQTLRQLSGQTKDP